MIKTFATLLTAGGLVSSAIIGSAAPAFAQPVAAPQPALVDLINPLMGTDSDHALSYGNTYPAIAVPWVCGFSVFSSASNEPATAPCNSG